jgi:hypothetical protein
MADKTMPTPAPWNAVGFHADPDWDGSWQVLYQNDCGSGALIADVPATPHAQQDARLIAAAGTAAHTLEQNGYDHLTLLKALPALATYARMTLGRDDFWSFVEKSAEQVDAGKEGDDGR